MLRELPLARIAQSIMWKNQQFGIFNRNGQEALNADNLAV